MGFTLGLDGKLMMDLDSAGTPRSAWPDSGTGGLPAGLTEFTNVRNVTTNIEFAEADITTRGGDGWRQFASTLKEASLDFESIWDPGDGATPTDMGKLFDAALANQTVPAVALDKTDPGGQGLWADWVATTSSRSEELEEAMTVDFSLRVGRGDVPPEWVTVEATP